MMRRIRSAMSLTLVALTMCATLPLTPTAAAQSAKSESGQPVPLSERLAVGVVRGEGARLRVNKLRAKNKALDRAMRDKERQGKRVNWELSATLIFASGEKKTARAGASIFTNASFSSALMEQQTLSDGTGEATFVTYDGDPSTWDGTIYRLDYYTGESEVYNASMADFGAIDDPAVWDVTDEVYYPPDGGPPTCNSGDNQNPALECGPVSKLDHRTPPSSPVFRKASLVTATPTANAVGPVIRWFTRFWRCYSRTLAFRGAACNTPQARIRNNLICYLAAGIYAAGCCARFAHYPNYGQGICFQ
jgi:hypothetical protein